MIRHYFPARVLGRLRLVGGQGFDLPSLRRCRVPAVRVQRSCPTRCELKCLGDAHIGATVKARAAAPFLVPKPSQPHPTAGSFQGHAWAVCEKIAYWGHIFGPSQEDLSS